jgi:hypothetical protein
LRTSEAQALANRQRVSPANSNAIFSTITPTIAFLQGRDPTLAHRICSRQFLPEGPRFKPIDFYLEDGNDDPLAWAFGTLGAQDRARTWPLFILTTSPTCCAMQSIRVLSLSATRILAQSQPTFDPLAEALAAPLNLVDHTLRDLTLDAVTRHTPNLVLLSVPFQDRFTPHFASRRRSRRTTHQSSPRSAADL